ncbi:hypothetical protein SARC_07131 [Sphaeroforma arctica JP610]|uniref:Uncharacterized protein n=1 Tax=Sphaeroforma arctica JP610 TaxID=667725 RepID=A0A0L0FV46_9EUKA|nr:hypothetical protein SARC_07131 [Sphaeroforma arctica JP610]KNC80509.1 hypothetical protein SARC_07131 [Sphaeroforma arctica JP610]|eukprot:XP_014154411.1 hypothetical protein SARC_07131 [Sphaeroforma arctica JP610]
MDAGLSEAAKKRIAALKAAIKKAEDNGNVNTHRIGREYGLDQPCELPSDEEIRDNIEKNRHVLGFTPHKWLARLLSEPRMDQPIYIDIRFSSERLARRIQELDQLVLFLFSICLEGNTRAFFITIFTSIGGYAALASVIAMRYEGRDKKPRTYMDRERGREHKDRDKDSKDSSLQSYSQRSGEVLNGIAIVGGGPYSGMTGLVLVDTGLLVRLGRGKVSLHTSSVIYVVAHIFGRIVLKISRTRPWQQILVLMPALQARID